MAESTRLRMLELLQPRQAHDEVLALFRSLHSLRLVADELGVSYPTLNRYLIRNRELHREINALRDELGANRGRGPWHKTRTGE